MGTSQTYNVRADNANGSSGTSASSNSVTTPFSVFGFFGAFYNFSPFTPFSVFFFSPNNFSLFFETEIITPNGLVKAGELSVGDKVFALDLGNYELTDWLTNWQMNEIDWNSNPSIVETTVSSIEIRDHENFIFIDGDTFTPNHNILSKKNGIIKFISASEIDTSYQIYSYEQASFVNIELVEAITIADGKLISINCEPYDNFFTKTMLVYDKLDS